MVRRKQQSNTVDHQMHKHASTWTTPQCSQQMAQTTQSHSVTFRTRLQPHNVLLVNSLKIMLWWWYRHKRRRLLLPDMMRTQGHLRIKLLFKPVLHLKLSRHREIQLLKNQRAVCSTWSINCRISSTIRIIWRKRFMNMKRNLMISEVAQVSNLRTLIIAQAWENWILYQLQS